MCVHKEKHKASTMCCLGNVGYMQLMVFLLHCILHPTVKKRRGRHLCIRDFIPLDPLDLIHPVFSSVAECEWCEGKVHEVTFCFTSRLMFTEGRFTGKAKTLGLLVCMREGLCVCGSHLLSLANDGTRGCGDGSHDLLTTSNQREKSFLRANNFSFVFFFVLLFGKKP